MKNNKFKLLLATVIALVALAVPPTEARAQNIVVLANGTASVPITASNVYTLSATTARDISLYVQFNLTAAGSTLNRCVIDTSNDNANWKTAAFQWDILPNGTTPVVYHTNIVANGIPFYRFTLHNSNSVQATNMIISYATKPRL